MISTATAYEQRRLPGDADEQRPAEEGRQRQAVHRRRVEPRDAVGEHDVARAALLGELHQAHDLGEQRALAGRA